MGKQQTGLNQGYMSTELIGSDFFSYCYFVQKKLTRDWFFEDFSKQVIMFDYC